MAGAVVARRDAVSPALILRVQTYDVPDDTAVERPRFAVDVFDRVLGGGVVGVALLLGGTAPKLDLHRRLDRVGAGVEVAGRDARTGESVVIAAAVER